MSRALLEVVWALWRATSIKNAVSLFTKDILKCHSKKHGYKYYIWRWLNSISPLCFQGPDAAHAGSRGRRAAVNVISNTALLLLWRIETFTMKTTCKSDKGVSGLSPAGAAKLKKMSSCMYTPTQSRTAVIRHTVKTPGFGNHSWAVLLLLFRFFFNLPIC